MTPQEKLALSFVKKHKPSGPTELGDMMGIHKQRAEVLLKSLEKQELIERTGKVFWRAK